MYLTELHTAIRGWASFYSNSDAQNVGILPKQDHLTYLKLRRWAKRRCGNINDGHIKYWTSIDGDNWVFATREGNANPLRLLKHSSKPKSFSQRVIANQAYVVQSKISYLFHK
ncbi:group II intron maturase-specific domain-containing protein [Nostoc sp.]|uniref:group II intron maturase-specific domain-containing protein n=1 Tax=Nostoc sp. TaxID=1180 RepID=UPI002FF6A023